MYRLFGTLLIGLLVCSSPIFGKDKPPQPIDQLYLYMEQDVFLEDKCLTYLKGMFCASTSAKLYLYAESDGPNGFILNIHERPEEDLPFRYAMIQVIFNGLDGVELRDVTDFYEDFPEVRRGKQIQIVVRRWLQGIQKAIHPDYRFSPLKQ